MDEVLGNLIRGLSKLPTYDGVTFRGATPDDTFGTTSGTVVARGLTATSRDARVATENFTAPAVYAVVGTHGRSVEGPSQHPGEHEVVFLPGALFRAVAQVRFHDIPVIVVEELDLDREPNAPKGDLDQLLGAISARLRRDLERPPVEITSPGKFVGDIA
jgi:hypothetical protein